MAPVRPLLLSRADGGASTPPVASGQSREPDLRALVRGLGYGCPHWLRNEAGACARRWLPGESRLRRDLLSGGCARERWHTWPWRRDDGALPVIHDLRHAWVRRCDLRRELAVDATV